MPNDLVRPRTVMEKLAARIHAHLERFETDPEINKSTSSGVGVRFYRAGAWNRGRHIQLKYIDYQGSTSLSRADAEAYLAWLDAGNIGRHFEALKK